jgi:hypothetical protein
MFLLRLICFLGDAEENGITVTIIPSAIPKKMSVFLMARELETVASYCSIPVI